MQFTLQKKYEKTDTSNKRLNDFVMDFIYDFEYSLANVKLCDII
jgi:hypothetical protein